MSFLYRSKFKFAAIGLLAVLLSSFALAKPQQARETPNAFAIASAHPLATRAGMQVLEAGGNAFDAAICVAAVLAVVEPYSAGMGGGGFWLLKLDHAHANKVTMVDARETAPSQATADLFLADDGQVDRDLAINTGLSAGIPGQAQAMTHIASRYGTLPLGTLLAPAITYAREGFAVDPKYQRLLQYRLETIQRYPQSSRIFLDEGKIPQLGQLIIQKDLANTLEAIAEQGRDGFYKGEIANKLVTAVNEAGGIWSKSDLAEYRVVERPPIEGYFRGYKIYSASPPSSGGIALLQTLKQLAAFDSETAVKPATQIHLTVESMRRAYHDRALYLGDPDFVKIPTARLLSTGYLMGLANTIIPTKATPSRDFKQVPQPKQGQHTTHFSVLDREGNAASVTLSINLPFGNGIVAEGTGVLLNNEMDDFSAAPSTPNAYGLIGLNANLIQGNKRPLSSMTPTLVTSNDKLGIIGTPGGSRIITMVALGVLSMTRDEPVERWVSQPRYHHQFFPDQIQHEPDAFPTSVTNELQAMGHSLRSVGRKYGNMQVILWDKRNKQVTAASDPRGIGLSLVNTLENTEKKFSP